MTGFDYGRSRAAADRLIARFGQSGAIRRTTTTGGDPFDPGGGETTVMDYPCTLVVTDFSLRERESTLVGATDKKVLIATDGIVIPALPNQPNSENAPVASDQVVVQNRAHEIVRIDPLSPGGTVVLWQAQVTF